MYVDGQKYPDQTARMRTLIWTFRCSHVTKGLLSHVAHHIQFSEVFATCLVHSIFVFLQLLGRFGTSEECGKACLFLAADATFCTGINILVSGGAELNYGIKNPKAMSPEDIV